MPLNLVLVEDHPRFREQLRTELETIASVRVIHAESTAPAAMRWLSEHPQDWDLLVVDLFLAHGHGFQVLAATKDRLPRQQAMLLTNYTRDPVREQARNFGADAVFDKAFEWGEFLEYVERCGKAKAAQVRAEVQAATPVAA